MRVLSFFRDPVQQAWKETKEYSGAGGVGFEVGEVDEFQGGGVGGGEDDRRGTTGVGGILPAGDAEAPEVAGLQAWEVMFRGWRDQVVALGDREGEEFRGHFGADDVDAMVAGAGTAVAVSVETGAGLSATNLQLSAQDVGRHGAAT